MFEYKDSPNVKGKEITNVLDTLPEGLREVCRPLTDEEMTAFFAEKGIYTKEERKAWNKRHDDLIKSVAASHSLYKLICLGDASDYIINRDNADSNK